MEEHHSPVRSRKGNNPMQNKHNGTRLAGQAEALAGHVNKHPVLAQEICANDRLLDLF